MAMMPTMVPVTAVAIPVTPPAAIARLLNSWGLVRLQRRNVGRKHRGARLRSVSPKCNGHRAAQRDERKQFPHMMPPPPNRQYTAPPDLCARSVDRSSSILHSGYAHTTPIHPNRSELKPLLATVWHVRATTEFITGEEGAASSRLGVNSGSSIAVIELAGARVYVPQGSFLKSRLSVSRLRIRMLIAARAPTMCSCLTAAIADIQI
jgi:hypothetical protein